MIAAMLTRLPDREAAERAVGNLTIRYCASTEELGRVVGLDDVTHVVCELRDETGGDVQPALRALSAMRRATLPVLLVADLSQWTARAILRIASVVSHTRVVLREDEELVPAIAAMIRSELPTGGGVVVLQRTSGVVEQSAREVITNAILLGNTKPQVRRLCVACGMSLRSLERRLVQSNLPSPRQLLGWTFTLQTIWRLERLDWSMKETAREAGFHTTSGLANAIKRHAGIGPRRLCMTLGFDGLLDRFIDQLSIVERRKS